MLWWLSHGEGRRLGGCVSRVKASNIIINIVGVLPSWRILKRFNSDCCKPRGPQHTYYYIVVIIVARKKMHEREMMYTGEQQKLPNEESHPVTDPLRVNSKNLAKKQKKSV